MDAVVIAQYRYLLAALAGGALLGLVAALGAGRRGGPPEATGPAPESQLRQILPHLMLLLVAVAAGTGFLLLLPAVTILRFFPGLPVTVLVLFAVALLGAPLLYAWRARPF